MAGAYLSRRIERAVGYPPLLELGELQRREFHEALLEANSFEDHSKSICAFSGLNDIPEGDPEEGPPGRTQSYGQDVANFGAVPQEFNPGDICNPNILPLK